MKNVLTFFLVLLIGGCAVKACIPDSKEETARKARETAENKEKGFHCLSSWDGSHRQFVAATKRLLNDPDSFDHVETRVTRRNASGKHEIYMEFSAKNAFGGRIKNVAIGAYNTSCTITTGPAIL